MKFMNTHKCEPTLLFKEQYHEILQEVTIGFEIHFQCIHPISSFRLNGMHILCKTTKDK